MFKLLGGRRENSRLCVAAYSQPLDTLAAEAQSHIDQGFTMIKLRFGWGPKDSAAAYARISIRCAACARRLTSIKCYMGWTLDYAERPRALRSFVLIDWPGALFIGCQVRCQACSAGGLYLTSIADVTVIYATAPFIAAGLAWWFFGEAMQAREPSSQRSSLSRVS